MSSMAARFCFRSSGTLLKNVFSFTGPCGPPSALAPLSETSMISVLILADLLEELDQLADVVVGVLEEAREHFLHARIEPPFVRGEFFPILHVGIVARELGVRRKDADLFLI